MKPTPPLTAAWIWTRQESYTPYHQVILARKAFRLPPSLGGLAPFPGGWAAQEGARSRSRWTAATGCSSTANGWRTARPASWPEAFQYDEIDVTPYLLAGQNELAIIARHWQTGDFHTCPQQAGLLAQLDIRTGWAARAGWSTDASWDAAPLPAWASDTPKVSIQMEPQELYDARLEGALGLGPAQVLYPAEGGPWKGLHARDVALMTRKVAPFTAFLGASLVKRKTDLDFCLPAVRLSHPGLVEANRFASAARGMVTLLDLAEPAAIRLALSGMQAAIDGNLGDGMSWTSASRAAHPAGLHLAGLLAPERAQPAHRRPAGWGSAWPTRSTRPALTRGAISPCPNSPMPKMT